MTNCPRCNQKMDGDFLIKIMDELALGGNQTEIVVGTECCEKNIKAINELGTYFITSEPENAGEKRIMIGAK